MMAGARSTRAGQAVPNGSDSTRPDGDTDFNGLLAEGRPRCSCLTLCNPAAQTTRRAAGLFTSGPRAVRTAAAGWEA
jgi:hypothetical protein